MTRPILSICIPTYNRAALLSAQLKTLDNALSNIPKSNYEVVFSDNCSTDNTREIVLRFGESHPIIYHKHEENIGLTMNLLFVPSLANGEFVWLLGDDDFIINTAIDKVLEILERHTDIEGIIVSHAIENENTKSRIEELVLAGASVRSNVNLIDQGTSEKLLPRFEMVFRYTAISAPLNFLSNVIFKSDAWKEVYLKYYNHCASKQWFSDTITSAGYLCLWAEILTGKPVYILPNPQVIGFLGRQEVLNKWHVMMMVHFLDVSNYFLKFGAKSEDVMFYRRSIYGDHNAMKTVMLFKGDYTKKYFSLRLFLKKYGNDEMVWQSLSRSFKKIKGRKSQLSFLFRLFSAVVFIPKRWNPALKLFLQTSKWFFNKRSETKNISRHNYQDEVIRLNESAKHYFQNVVKSSNKSLVQHPVYFKNPQYVKIGSNFSACAGLRIEAWDKHKGVKYYPKIIIGDRVIFNFNVHLGCINEIQIGNDALVGSNVLITDHQHGNLKDLVNGKSYRDQPLYSKGPVIIGNNVWIGENVSIMPGVSIGDNCVIGANSVVTKSFMNNKVIGGIPAKVLNEVPDYRV